MFSVLIMAYIWMSPSLTAGSLLGAQTDHLHIETSDSMNTWKFSHLEEKE